MKTAGTTPTGKVGSRVVRLLVQPGARPTLLLRDAGHLETDPLVDTVEGDQCDEDVVLRATDGADPYAIIRVDLDSCAGRRRLLHGHSIFRVGAFERLVVDNGLIHPEEPLCIGIIGLTIGSDGQFFWSLADELLSVYATSSQIHRSQMFGGGHTRRPHFEIYHTHDEPVGPR